MADVAARSITPRLSTAGPFNVARWTDEEADKDVALNSIMSLIKQPAAMPSHTVAAQPTLTLGGLGLQRVGLAEQPIQASVPKPAPVQEPVNPSGVPIKSGGGISAYGYKGVTGLAQHRGAGQYGLQNEMADALARANAAMKAAGLGTFSVTDGFRSYDAQVATKKRKGSLAATPGRSIHGLGLAADLKLSKAQQQWLYKNGARYGLYAGAGFSREPWHWQLIPSLYKRGWA